MTLASFSTLSCMGTEDCQLYTGAGFPVAVQFNVISPPGIKSKISGSGLRNVGGTRENITVLISHRIEHVGTCLKSENSFMTHNTQMHREVLRKRWEVAEVPPVQAPALLHTCTALHFQLWLG